MNNVPSPYQWKPNPVALYLVSSTFPFPFWEISNGNHKQMNNFIMFRCWLEISNGNHKKMNSFIIFWCWLEISNGNHKEMNSFIIFRCWLQWWPSHCTLPKCWNWKYLISSKKVDKLWSKKSWLILITMAGTLSYVKVADFDFFKSDCNKKCEAKFWTFGKSGPPPMPVLLSICYHLCHVKSDFKKVERKIVPR